MNPTDFPMGGQPTDPKAPVHPAPLALAHVPFRGGFIEAAQLEGEVFVPLRPLCDALGVSLQGQLAKLRGKPWACIKMILSQMPGDDQTRQLAAVDLRSLPLWLATIEPSRVKPEARPALVAYQREAAEVLYRHFLAPPVDGAAVAQLAADVASLRGEVRELRERDRRRSREPAPLGVGFRLSIEDAARVRAYCETRPIVATADAMREALGLTTWTNVEASALAIELRELGYERRKTYVARGCQKWRWRRVHASPLSLVSFRPEAPAQLAGRDA